MPPTKRTRRVQHILLLQAWHLSQTALKSRALSSLILRELVKWEIERPVPRAPIPHVDLDVEWPHNQSSSPDPKKKGRKKSVTPTHARDLHPSPSLL